MRERVGLSVSLLVRLLRAAADALEAGALQSAPASCDPWVDQNHSPLGRKTHCRLVRERKLPGAKVGRFVLVRQTDMDAFIEAHRMGTVSANDMDHAAGSDLSPDLQALGFR